MVNAVLRSGDCRRRVSSKARMLIHAAKHLRIPMNKCSLNDWSTWRRNTCGEDREEIHRIASSKARWTNDDELRCREFVFHNSNIFVDRIDDDFRRCKWSTCSPRRGFNICVAVLWMKFTSSGKAVRNSSSVNKCSLDVCNLNWHRSTHWDCWQWRFGHTHFSTTSSTGFSQPTYCRAKSAVATAN